MAAASRATRGAAKLVPVAIENGRPVWFTLRDTTPTPGFSVSSVPVSVTTQLPPTSTTSGLTPLNAPGPVRENGAISRAAAMGWSPTRVSPKCVCGVEAGQCPDGQGERGGRWLSDPCAGMHQVQRVGVLGVEA